MVIEEIIAIRDYSLLARHLTLKKKNLPDAMGKRPLDIACSVGSLEATKIMFEKGVKFVNTNRFSPLCLAVQSGSYPLVLFLLEEIKKQPKTIQTSLLDGYNSLGFFPLYYAVQNDIRIVKALVNAGATVDKVSKRKGKSSLFVAAILENLPIVKFLLLNGANPHLKDKDGKDVCFYLRGEQKKHMKDYFAKLLQGKS